MKKTLNRREFRNVVTEEVTKLLTEMLLNEDAESKGRDRIKAAIRAYGKNLSDADVLEKYNDILKEINRIDLPYYTNANGIQKRTYKFGQGVVRFYMTGQLADNVDKAEMNKILMFLSENPTFADKYDADFNGKTFQEVENETNSFMSQAKSEENNALNNQKIEGKSDYKVVRIPDFQTAKRYAKYMVPEECWCVTQDESAFKSYTQQGAGLFYFFLKNGFENVPRVKGETFPLDEYGLSMIAVSIMDDGNINSVTCRWNHTDRIANADNILTAEQLQEITKYYKKDVLIPFTEEELRAKGIVSKKMIVKKLNNGEKPENIFPCYLIDGDDHNKWYVYLSKNNWNIFNTSTKKFEGEGGYDGIAPWNPIKIIVPNGVTNLPNDTFEYADTLETISLPNTLITIGENCFLGCTSLKEITMPDSVKYIGKRAFMYCDNLKFLRVPENVEFIGEDAFVRTEWIRWQYKEGPVYIGKCLLSYKNYNEKDVIIKEGTTTICDSAFCGCTIMTGITLPSTLKVIDIDAFRGCSNLQKIDLPYGLEKISTYAFLGCAKLKEILIPPTVKTIGRNSFANCFSLEELEIEEGVEQIGYMAFSNCSSLRSVTIPKSVTIVGEKAFYDCRNLSYVYYENKDMQIGRDAFPHKAQFIYFGEEYNEENNKTEQGNQTLNEIRDNFYGFLNRMDGLFI